MPTARRGAKTIGPIVIAALSVAVVGIKLLSASREATKTATVVGGSPATDQGGSGNNDGSWWQENSTVIIAVLSVAVVAIRLLGVSRGDPEIAYAILQAGGTGNILIATLISTLGLLAIPLCATLGLDAANAWDTRHISARFHILFASSLVLLYIVLYMAPAGLLFLSVCYAIFMYLIYLIHLIWLLASKKRGSPQEHENHQKTFFSPKTFLIIGICVYTTFLLGYEVFSPTPWLPVQQISIAGQKPFAGYVLSEANGETSILTSKPEEVIYLRTQSIQHSMQCTPPLYLEEQATLAELWEHYRRKLITYTSCPSAPYN
jgi:hypothetical protein